MYQVYLRGEDQDYLYGKFASESAAERFIADNAADYESDGRYFYIAS